MADPAPSFVHRFVAASGTGRPPLLLLHGTGGDEDDLLGIGPMVAPGAALLSPRGQVLENGRPRFFRRLAEGVFDEDDLRRRTADLAGFVAAARAAHGLAAPVAFGFSNGANIAAALLLLRPGCLAGAVLVRAMPPFAAPPPAALAGTPVAGTPVLILSGAADPLIPAAAAQRLAADLVRSGADVDHRVLPGGHGLTRQDLDLARVWLDRRAG